MTAFAFCLKITGAHFNASITVGVLMTEDFTNVKQILPTAIIMLVGQIIGGYLGFLISWIELGSEKILVLQPMNPYDYTPWMVFLIETLFTFIFICCILNSILPKLSLQSDPMLALLSAAFCLYFCIGCTGPLTGACLNPTLGLVSTTFGAIVRKGNDMPNFMSYLLSYIFGPLIGGLLAGIICKYCVIPAIPKKEN